MGHDLNRTLISERLLIQVLTFQLNVSEDKPNLKNTFLGRGAEGVMHKLFKETPDLNKT